MATTINTFIIYAREDKDIKNRIVSYLTPFKTAFNLVIWHDDNIDPGQLWQQKIKDNLEQTDLFILLVSIDFMNSDFITKVECKYAIDMHKTNKAVVIPVIIKPCPWDIDIDLGPYFFNLSDLQVLPDEAKPIVDWNSSDNAYNNIAKGIRKFLDDIVKRRKDAESVIALEKEREMQLKLKKEEEERLRKEQDERLKKEENERLKKEQEEQLKKGEEERLKKEGANRKKIEYQDKLISANKEYRAGSFKKALAIFTELSIDRLQDDDIAEKIKQTKEKIALEEAILQKRENPTTGTSIESYKIRLLRILKKYRIAIFTVLSIIILLTVIFGGLRNGKPPQTILQYPGGLEEKEWNIAVQKNDPDGYRLYQYEFPSGAHFKEAQEKIDHFDQPFK